MSEIQFEPAMNRLNNLAVALKYRLSSDPDGIEQNRSARSIKHGLRIWQLKSPLHWNRSPSLTTVNRLKQSSVAKERFIGGLERLILTCCCGIIRSLFRLDYSFLIPGFTNVDSFSFLSQISRQVSSILFSKSRFRNSSFIQVTLLRSLNLNT